MNTFLSIVATVLMVLGVFLILGVTPEQIATDLMNILRPIHKLRTQVEDVQENKRRTGVYAALMTLRNTMEATGRGKLFPFVFTAAGALGFLGFLIAVFVDNLWVAPSLVVALGMIPFLYMSGAISSYEKSVRDEMETALSIVTNAYIRTDDITMAIQENVRYIKPPLKHAFNHFLQDSVVMPSTKQALYRLRSRVNDQVYYEWVTTLIQCQDDRTLKDNLYPIVNKLTDIRLINTQMANTINSARTEYYSLVGFLFASVPLLYFINRDSLTILVSTPLGKFLIGIVSAVTLVTFFFMRKYTKPVTFNDK